MIWTSKFQMGFALLLLTPTPGSGIQVDPWDSVAVTSRSSVEAYLAEYPRGGAVEHARLSLLIHDKMRSLSSGESKPRFFVPTAELGPTEPDVSESLAPYAVGVSRVRKEVSEGEAVKFGSYVMEYSTAVSMGVIRDGILEKTEAMDVFGKPSILSVAGSQVNFPFISGSIIAVRTEGSSFALLDYAQVDSHGAVLYFGMVEGIGMVHLHGDGSAQLADGSTIELR